MFCSDAHNRIAVEPISNRLRLDTPAGRIQIVRSVLNIVRLMAAYNSKLPGIPVALGRPAIRWYLDGSERSEVMFFSGDHTMTSFSAVSCGSI